MVRLIRSFFFGRWLRVQGGEVSLLPLLILLAAALAISWFNQPEKDITRLPGPISFNACTGGERTNCVVDGDTIWAAGEKIRLADIDAPEVFSPECDWERLLGERASARLAVLLNEGDVALEKPSSRDRDKYGRLLRVATVDGRSVGDQLIAEGLAYQWGRHQRGWCS
ncbi:MAG: thermonuclease family protein [Henriciella sp.]|uniref:thermonuclease family protein n=1 Tax=Henriciella sp. TaxID=1968823 RepID=UPI0032EDD51B